MKRIATLVITLQLYFLFVYVGALRPSQQIYSQVGMFSCLPRLNGYLPVDLVSS